MNLEELRSEFYQYFRPEMDTKNQVEIKTFFSPGRVNLIGEHIDYNGGMVLPCAINLGTYAVTSRREDRLVKLFSLNFKELGILTFDLDAIEPDEKMDWANYPMGVMNEIQNRGHIIQSGFNLLYYGDLPNGAGLSSSASIEVLTATIVEEYENFGIDRVEIARLCQKSENEFNGVNCGIMDQFSIAVGAKESAIVLDCNTLDYRYVPADLADYRIIIANTNKKRGLVDSEYNARRKECERALEILQKNNPERKISALCDLKPAEFIKLSDVLKEEKVYKRSFHAVVENERTLQSAKALESGDLMVFGEWMYRSHESLKHNYEVSCRELDVIVELSKSVRGVLGARMTGAGFGGCAIALVHRNACNNFMETVGKGYAEQTGLKADFYIAEISEGAGVVYDSF